MCPVLGYRLISVRNHVEIESEAVYLCLRFSSHLTLAFHFNMAAA